MVIIAPEKWLHRCGCGCGLGCDCCSYAVVVTSAALCILVHGCVSAIPFFFVTIWVRFCCASRAPPWHTALSFPAGREACSFQHVNVCACVLLFDKYSPNTIIEACAGLRISVRCLIAAAITILFVAVHRVRHCTGCIAIIWSTAAIKTPRRTFGGGGRSGSS